jgi:hypothetical protein
VMVREAYAGFSVKSAAWHSSELKALREGDLPVGTWLMRSLDHLMFGLILEGFVGKREEAAEKKGCKAFERNGRAEVM